MQLILNSFIAGSIYALVTLGFNLIYSTTKFFNLAHGAMATVGGYTVFYFSKTLGLNILLSVLFGLLVAGFVGYLTNKIVFKPLRKRGATNMVLIVASLGLLTAIESLIAILFSSQFQTLSNNQVTQKLFHIFGGVVTQTQILIFISSIIIMLGLMFVLKYTLFGSAVRAISDDEEVAKVIGIDTDKILTIVFVVGSIIAGWSGILTGFDTGLTPILGMGLLLKGVISSIVGGVGRVGGGVLGAFMLGFVENFGIWYISSEWKDAIAFGVLILFLVFRPHGIFGKK